MGSSAPVNFYAKACHGKFEDENASDSPEEPSWISRRLARSHLALKSSSMVLPTMPRLAAEWREPGGEHMQDGHGGPVKVTESRILMDLRAS